MKRRISSLPVTLCGLLLLCILLGAILLELLAKGIYPCLSILTEHLDARLRSGKEGRYSNEERGDNKVNKVERERGLARR